MAKTAAPIGILGDGQLALMLGESALSQGLDFIALGSSQDSSFARAFPDRFILGDPKNSSDCLSFAARCSALTLENEFISGDVLHKIESETGTPIIPGASSYRHFESKIAQRSLYQSLGIPSPRWASVQGTKEEIQSQIESQFHYPLVLKANRGGYDGYGVRMVASGSELGAALTDLHHSEQESLLVEEKIGITREFAQGALFDGKGGAILLPLMETVQRNGICILVLSKPSIPEKERVLISTEITHHLHQIAKSGLVGLFNFEFFYTTNQKILINEGAPRPHNSQHLSLNACMTSQFDLLTHFLKDLKLPHLDSPIQALPGVMINLLGQRNSESYQLKIPALPEGLSIHPKLYLKKESRVGRKMGHLNLIDPSGTFDLALLGEKLLKEYTL